MLIGPYVITGWGPREIAAEEKRREFLRIAAEDEKSRQIAAGRGLLFATLAIVLTPVAMFQGGILLITAAIGAGLLALIDFFTLSKDEQQNSSSSDNLSAEVEQNT